jgi:hypothetical protein
MFLQDPIGNYSRGKKEGRKNQLCVGRNEEGERRTGLERYSRRVRVLQIDGKQSGSGEGEGGK